MEQFCTGSNLLQVAFCFLFWPNCHRKGQLLTYARVSATNVLPQKCHRNKHKHYANRPAHLPHYAQHWYSMCQACSRWQSSYLFPHDPRFSFQSKIWFSLFPKSSLILDLDLLDFPIFIFFNLFLSFFKLSQLLPGIILCLESGKRGEGWEEALGTIKLSLLSLLKAQIKRSSVFSPTELTSQQQQY